MTSTKGASATPGNPSVPPHGAQVLDIAGRPPPRGGIEAVAALLRQAAVVAELGEVEAALAGVHLAGEVLDALARRGRGA